MASSLEFENVVARFYEPLYQFAFSLTRAEADACDLTQQTFYVWATKGHQLREASKVKTWLFTTLHRAFLETVRKQTRFAHQELSDAIIQSLAAPATTLHQTDSVRVLDCLGRLDEVFRAPVALFYLEDCSYKEIAEILELPMGTVKSRMARGIHQLQQMLASDLGPFGPKRKGANE